MMGDAMVLLVGHRTCDSHVVGSSPGRALPRTGLRQATYTCMLVSPSSIICNGHGADVLFGWERNHGPARSEGNDCLLLLSGL